jgi:arsenate-mycothiol transferase
LKKFAGDTVDVDSAGTKPGNAVNDLSAQALQEVGVDITGQTPKAITPEMLLGVDLVVTIGREAKIDQIEGTRFENWTPGGSPSVAGPVGRQLACN